MNNNNEEDRKFNTAEELKDWLVTVKGLDKEDAMGAASILYEQRYNKTSKLIGITVDVLKGYGISDPMARELSNKLKERPPPQQEPPRKVARTEEEPTLTSIDGIPFVKPWEVVVPKALIDSPAFTAENNWLNDVCNQVLLQMLAMETEEDRISPLCLARCSRGGKTRALYEMANRIKKRLPDAAVIFVTFNDYSDIQQWEQNDPVRALCRRIAFAASKGRDFQTSREQYEKQFKYARVEKKWVIDWLSGAQSVLLLIDELNLVKNFGPKGHGPESLSKMLKEFFMLQAGRYFVFSSHVVTIDNSLSHYMDSKSDRFITKKSLPLITTLSTAVINLSSTLTASEAIFYGLVPALVYTANKGKPPCQKRIKIMEEWIKNEKISDRTVKFLLATMVTGMREGLPEMLLELMDVTDGGLVKWIPYHMFYILKVLKVSPCPNLSISEEMCSNIQKILDLFTSFRDATTGNGEGWEALFVLTLLVRALTGQHHELMGMENISDVTRVNFDKPYKEDAKVPLHHETSLEAFLGNIPDTVGCGPQVSLFYPRHASFEVYDCFLVFWNTQGRRSCVTGYQLKTGKGSPKAPCQRISKSFLIRGSATQTSGEVRGWVAPCTDELEAFFGISGRQWTPDKWDSLLLPQSI